MSDRQKASVGRFEVHVWRIEIARGEQRVAARRSLREILARYLGTDPGEIELQSGERGKPRLADPAPPLGFNLSHSGALALVAVATGEVEVGIDVELVQPRRDLVRLAARWLPAEDAAAIAAVPEAEREAAFYAAWTRYEARVKCTGAGIGGPPPGPEIVARDLEIDLGYAAAVATVGPPPFVRRFETVA